jgi:hypothetical protein
LLPFSAKQLQMLTVAALHPIRVALRLPRTMHANTLCMDLGFLPFDLRQDQSLARLHCRYIVSHNALHANNDQPHARDVLHDEMQLVHTGPPAFHQRPAFARLLSTRIGDLYNSGRANAQMPVLKYTVHQSADLIRARFDWTDAAHNCRFTPNAANRRWGRPLRNCIAGGPPTLRNPTPAESLRFYHAPLALTHRPLGLARDVAAARYDMFSYWRQHKRKQRPSDICPHCNHSPANAQHLLLDCPYFSQFRADTFSNPDLTSTQRAAVRRFGTSHDIDFSDDAILVAATIAVLVRRIRRSCAPPPPDPF